MGREADEVGDRGGRRESQGWRTVQG
jgi:hypothetical protein